jgi:hypothetical protein
VLSLETHNEKYSTKNTLGKWKIWKVTQATNDVIWDWDIINHTFYRSKAVESFGKMPAR